MLWMGFESTTPVFERAKTVHALDHVATVTGQVLYTIHNMRIIQKVKFWWATKEITRIDFQAIYIAIWCT
jgi:hypothetical protein